MLKKRLIACLLWRNCMLIQSKGFQHKNSVGNAFTAVDFFNTWAIDEIVILDVSKESDDRERFHRDLVHMSARCFVPLAVGGWVQSTDDIRRLLTEGADKVVINTEAFRNHSLITQGAERFGKQCIVISIDAKRDGKGGHEVYINRGAEPTGMQAVDWAKKAEELGAGEIFLTSIDQDGLLGGYDCELTRSVSDAVSIPVIASGGVGKWEHFKEGIDAGASAISAANIFYYMDLSTKKAKNFLFEHSVDVRRPEFYDVKIPRQVIYDVPKRLAEDVR
jgi:imidazole glycerol-phosphate synthase subunit HisF